MAFLPNWCSPRWRQETDLIVALMRACPVQGTITYDQLSAAAGMEIRSQSRPLRAALTRLEKEGILFRNLPSLGYLRPTDKAAAATDIPRARRKTFRAGKRSLRKTKCIDDNNLDRSQRVTLWAQATAFSTVARDLHGNAIRRKAKEQKPGVSLFKEEKDRLSKEANV
jgi:hypothetical protein